MHIFRNLAKPVLVPVATNNHKHARSSIPIIDKVCICLAFYFVKRQIFGFKKFKKVISISYFCAKHFRNQIPLQRAFRFLAFLNFLRKEFRQSFPFQFFYFQINFPPSICQKNRREAINFRLALYVAKN